MTKDFSKQRLKRKEIKAMAFDEIEDAFNRLDNGWYDKGRKKRK